MNPFKIIFNRAFPLATFMLLQIGLLAFMVILFEEYFVYFFWLSLALSFVVMLLIINNSSNFVYKIGWIIPVYTFPLFGSLMYILYGGNKLGKKTKKRMRELLDISSHHLKQDSECRRELRKDDSNAANQANYILNYSKAPIYNDSYTEFFKIGEDAFVKMVEELEKAEKFIFLEYFIVDDGVMWDTILEILKRKVKEGVEVRMIYDDIGCLFTLPNKYYKKLEKFGIKCKVFHPLTPIFTFKYNNRDHRKILVIDNKVGFTGGINLADEYINGFVKHGHWKDSAIMVKGPAVKSFTMFFMRMWDYVAKENTDYDKYLDEPSSIEDIELDGEHIDKVDMCDFKSDSKTEAALKDKLGYVQPFSDSPLDNEALSETMYMNILGSAQDYVYITTPYLILDDAMKSAICAAGKRGVDVRIILPHIPDKWYVHSVSKSHYNDLLRANVKIYEYTPGFIHSKMFISDDKYSVVGTINLDYRSLYLHFECGVWMYKSVAMKDIKRDILNTIKKSQRIRKLSGKEDSLPTRLLRSLLRILSPIM